MEVTLSNFYNYQRFSAHMRKKKKRPTWSSYLFVCVHFLHVYFKKSLDDLDEIQCKCLQ